MNIAAKSAARNLTFYTSLLCQKKKLCVLPADHLKIKKCFQHLQQNRHRVMTLVRAVMVRRVCRHQAAVAGALAVITK